MKKILAGILVCAVFSSAADLTISGQSGKTYDGGSYGKLIIKSSSNIVVRNCKFSATTGTVGLVDNGCSSVTVENCEFDGNENACTGFSFKGATTKKITLKNSLIKNIADDGILVASCSEITVQGIEMRNLISKGTDGRIDGPCYNGHSDGFELSNCHNSTFEGNLIYDIKGTSAFYFGSYADVCTDIRVVNNLMYTPECGFVVYIKDVNGLEFCNNTIWKGSNGGVALGGGITDMKMYNNICSTINTKHFNITLNSNHDLQYNLMGLTNQGVTAGPTDVWAVNCLFQRIPPVIGGDILYDVVAQDFSLLSGSPAIGKGRADGGVPATDFFGNSRSVPYDIGGIEYQGTGIDVTDQLRQWQARVGVQDDGNYFSVTGRPVAKKGGYSGIRIRSAGSGVEKAIVIR